MSLFLLKTWLAASQRRSMVKYKIMFHLVSTTHEAGGEEVMTGVLLLVECWHTSWDGSWSSSLMIVAICFDMEAKLFMAPAALMRSFAASLWDEAATRYKSKDRAELRATAGNIASRTPIIVEHQKIKMTWREDPSGDKGKLPEK
jgi:hypothetical protein